MFPFNFPWTFALANFLVLVLLLLFKQSDLTSDDDDIGRIPDTSILGRSRIDIIRCLLDSV